MVANPYPRHNHHPDDEQAEMTPPFRFPFLFPSTTRLLVIGFQFFIFFFSILLQKF